MVCQFTNFAGNCQLPTKSKMTPVGRPLNVNVTFCPTQNSGVLVERSTGVPFVLAIMVTGYFIGVAQA